MSQYYKVLPFLTYFPRVHHLEPSWRYRQQLRWAELPVGLVGWLFDHGSLTKRLRQACPAHIRVNVLGQRLARPMPSEAQLLGVGAGVHVWVREVQLLCGKCPWVFARTLIPISSLRGRCQRLINLGARPLGEVLFADPRVQRSEVEVACIHPRHRLHQRVFENLSAELIPIWGRRSVFNVDRKPLLVCEVFLPDMPRDCPYGITNANKCL